MRLKRVLLRVWIVVLCAALGGAAGYLVKTRTAKRYTATATVYVTGSGGVSGSLVSDEQVASYASIATSAPLLTEVASRVGHGSTAASLKGEVAADVTAGTTLIAIKVEDRSGARAAAIANATVTALRSTVQRLQGGARLVSVQSAADPLSASSPKLVTDVGIGLAIGLFLGLLCAAAMPRRR